MKYEVDISPEDRERLKDFRHEFECTGCLKKTTPAKLDDLPVVFEKEGFIYIESSDVYLCKTCAERHKTRFVISKHTGKTVI